MIRIRMAGLNIGIDNRYDFSRRVAGFKTEDAPDFTVSVTEEELLREAEHGGYQAREYLEYICAYRRIAEILPEYDAFVMHGAVVSLDGREAYLFAAPSGTGKTTHVRLWLLRFPGRAAVLNGDKPILRMMNGTFYACGTPWRGKENLGGTQMLPLAGICVLRRGAENHAARISAQQAVGAIMKQIYLPKELPHLDRFMTLLNECVTTVPISLLHCDRSAAAPAAAYEALTGLPAEPEPELPPELYRQLHFYDGTE